MSVLVHHFQARRASTASKREGPHGRCLLHVVWWTSTFSFSNSPQVLLHRSSATRRRRQRVLPLVLIPTGLSIKSNSLTYSHLPQSRDRRSLLISYCQYSMISSSSRSSENLPPQAVARLARELKDLFKDPPAGFRIIPGNNLGELVVSGITFFVEGRERAVSHGDRHSPSIPMRRRLNTAHRL